MSNWTRWLVMSGPMTSTDRPGACPVYRGREPIYRDVPPPPGPFIDPQPPTDPRHTRLAIEDDPRVLEYVADRILDAWEEDPERWDGLS